MMHDTSATSVPQGLPPRARKRLAKEAEQYTWWSARRWIGDGILVAIFLVLLWLHILHSLHIWLLLILFIPCGLIVNHFFHRPAFKEGLRRRLAELSSDGRLTHCVERDYDLRATRGDTCPECGAWVEADRLLVAMLKRR